MLHASVHQSLKDHISFYMFIPIQDYFFPYRSTEVFFLTDQQKFLGICNGINIEKDNLKFKKADDKISVYKFSKSISYKLYKIEDIKTTELLNTLSSWSFVRVTYTRFTRFSLLQFL